MPEQLPRGEPEPGGGPGPPESTGLHPFCFTYWIRAFACLSPPTTGERNSGCGGALESRRGKAGGSGHFLPLQANRLKYPAFYTQALAVLAPLAPGHRTLALGRRLLRALGAR